MKFRHEYKHEINTAEVYELRSRLRAVLPHDSHAGSDGFYSVKSLYFDNYMDKVIREKQDGVDGREKFRIRYYGTDTSFIQLEKKSKLHGLCNKQCARITAGECQRLIEGDTAFLLQSDNMLLRELYAKMQYQLLRPKSIVAYDRECFVYAPGNVRVTFDMNISGSYNVREFLNPDLQLLQLFHHTVLEVKWDNYLPQLIRDLVQIKSRQSAAFSKYAAVRIY